VSTQFPTSLPEFQKVFPDDAAYLNALRIVRAIEDGSHSVRNGGHHTDNRNSGPDERRLCVVRMMKCVHVDAGQNECRGCG
jgi:hypothetical protein